MLFGIFTRKVTSGTRISATRRSGNGTYSEQFICASCGPLHPNVSGGGGASTPQYKGTVRRGPTLSGVGGLSNTPPLP